MLHIKRMFYGLTATALFGAIVLVIRLIFNYFAERYGTSTIVMGSIAVFVFIWWIYTTGAIIEEELKR